MTAIEASPSAVRISGERLSAGEKISYGAGDLAASLAWNAAAAFALYFYTDIALLPAAAIGSLFFFTRIFDAVFDLFLGAAVDRTRSRWGRARPYLLFGAVPFGVLTALTFYAPEASQDIRLAYAWATYFLLGLLVSIANIPYSALMPLMTSDLKQKLDLSAMRSVGTSVGVIAVTAGFLPLADWLGGDDRERGFFLAAALMGAVSAGMLLVTFANCRERNLEATPTNDRIADSLKRLFANRAWISVSLFALLNFVRFGGILALTPFFAINVLGQPWTISILMPTLSGTLLLGALFAPPILKRLGMRRGCSYALLAAGALYLVLPFTESAPWTFIAVYVSASLILSVTMTATYAMASDAVDYHEWREGVRQEGLLSAGVAFAIKVGMALGGALIAFVLASAGYDPSSVTDRAKDAMSLLYYGLPLLVFVAQLLAIRLYDVDAKRTEIDAFLNERRSAANPGAATP